MCCATLQVAPCYPAECKSIPDQLINLLKGHYDTIAPSLRLTMVQALILLRNKDFIPTTQLLSLFFLLFQCHDKHLRALVYTHLVHDIQAANKHHRNHALNKTLQNYLYNIIAEDNEICAYKSLQVMIALYRKQVWTDAKTVNCIAQGCHSKVPKTVMMCLRFFLGKMDENTEESDDEDVDLEKMKHGIHVGKKKKSKERKLQKAMLTVKKVSFHFSFLAYED
jgi:protein SDA1